MNDNHDIFRSGAQLLSEWGCNTREQKLERACRALMAELNRMHVSKEGCDLAEHINDQHIFCSCADAFRMGDDALRLSGKWIASIITLLIERPMTRREIHKALVPTVLPTEEAQIDATLRALVRAGQINRFKRGHYELAHAHQ